MELFRTRLESEDQYESYDENTPITSTTTLKDTGNKMTSSDFTAEIQRKRSNGSIHHLYRKRTQSEPPPTSFQDPVIEPLQSLLHNLNLDALQTESIDLDEFLNGGITPNLLASFLNENGFDFHHSTFESVSHQQLQSMFNETKLKRYMKRKVSHPAHRYSLSSFVHDDYMDSMESVKSGILAEDQKEEEESATSRSALVLDKFILNTVTPDTPGDPPIPSDFDGHSCINRPISKISVLHRNQSTESIGASPRNNNHINGLSVQSPDTFIQHHHGPFLSGSGSEELGPLAVASPSISDSAPNTMPAHSPAVYMLKRTVSAALQSTLKPPSINKEMIQNILCGIQNVMMYQHSEEARKWNKYLVADDSGNAVNGQRIEIGDDDLKRECLESTKCHQKSQLFEFEEYADTVFALLRTRWDLKGLKYLYKLFGIDMKQRKNIKNAFNLSPHLHSGSSSSIKSYNRLSSSKFTASLSSLNASSSSTTTSSPYSQSPHQQKVDLEFAATHFWKSLITNSKSGQLFYRSVDNLFILKALKYDEWHLLRHGFLFYYFRHILSHPDSLLTKILGVYRIDGTYFMVMQNVHYCTKPLDQPMVLHKVYDLKGSTHNRQATRHKLVLDRTDFAAISNLAMEDDFLDEDEAETMDNMRHKYSPSWYKPTGNEDHSKIKVVKSDTLNSPNINTVHNVHSNPLHHYNGFDGGYGTYSNHDSHFIMSRNKLNVGSNAYGQRTKNGNHYGMTNPSRHGIVESKDEEEIEDIRWGPERALRSEKRMQSAAAVEVWKRSKILKDLDWIQDEQLIKIGKIRSSVFLNQLNIDLEFLTKMNVMDYSLLIGIHFRDRNEDQNEDEEEQKTQNPARWDTGKLFSYEFGGMCYDRSEEINDTADAIQHKDEEMPQKNAIYFGGIIDFLQVYTATKKLETFVKGLAHERKNISSIDPESYAKRLHAFIQKSCE